jgi:hypothetical protein
MMSSAAARKQKVVVPTLEERVRVLMEELDAILDQIAEERRPKGEDRAIPVGCIRQELDIRGGHCFCRSYLAATKQPK